MLVDKCVQLFGNLKSEKIIYKLCPNTEFSNGDWEISVSSLCVSSAVEESNFWTISCNFSVNKKISHKGEFEIYEQPLATVFINLKAGNKSINRFSYPLWLKINRISDSITFTFSQNSSTNKITKDCDIILNILFRRVA